MRRLLAIATTFCLATAAWAQTPATQPAAGEVCPAGGTAASATALPPGHPPLDMDMGSTTQPDVKGTLTIKTVQGTPGGPAIGAEEATVEIFHRGRPLQQVGGTLDNTGGALVKELPVGIGIIPRVTVKHAGISYQVVGEPMDAAHPDQMLEVKVYETTEQAPAWRVGMRHVMAMPAKDGVQVMEDMVIVTPGDKAWAGVAEGEHRTTLKLQLPTGAKNLQLGDGLDDGATRLENGVLHVGTAFQPGKTTLEFIYQVPAEGGQAALALTAPGPVTQLVVMLPSDGTTATPQGLEAGKPITMGRSEKTMRVYQAKDLAAGQQVALTVGNLSVARANLSDPAAAQEEDGVAAAAAETPGKASDMPKIIAAVGGVGLLVAGAVVMLVRAPKKAGERTAAKA